MRKQSTLKISQNFRSKPEEGQGQESKNVRLLQHTRNREDQPYLRFSSTRQMTVPHNIAQISNNCRKAGIDLAS